MRGGREQSRRGEGEGGGEKRREGDRGRERRESTEEIVCIKSQVHHNKNFATMTVLAQ